MVKGEGVYGVTIMGVPQFVIYSCLFFIYFLPRELQRLREQA